LGCAAHDVDDTGFFVFEFGLQRSQLGVGFFGDRLHLGNRLGAFLHDPVATAQVLLVTNSRNLAHAVIHEIDRQLARLSRGDIVRAALAGSRIILVNDLETALEVSNLYAPEHLIIETERARDWLASVRHAGSVFLGAWTPESMGDYCSGTNHVLPTYGYARSFSGLSLADFTRQITVQELTPEGLAGLGPVAQTLAMLEGLDAHANAVTVRLAHLPREDE